MGLLVYASTGSGRANLIIIWLSLVILTCYSKCELCLCLQAEEVCDKVVNLHGHIGIFSYPVFQV